MARGFFNRILDAVGLEEEEFENDEVMDEEEDYYEDEPIEEPEEEQRFSRRRQSKVVGLPNSAGRNAHAGVSAVQLRRGGVHHRQF